MRDFVMTWDDMEYTGHRKFFYVLVVVPEVLFMLRSHNVSQQVRWRDGCWAKLGLLTMLVSVAIAAPMLVVECIAPAPAV